jgi:hypothetical protein
MLDLPLRYFILQIKVLTDLFFITLSNPLFQKQAAALLSDAAAINNLIGNPAMFFQL